MVKKHRKAEALNADAQQLLIKLANLLRAGGYSESTVRNYTSEVRLLFSYFNDVDPLPLVRMKLFSSTTSHQD